MGYSGKIGWKNEGLDLLHICQDPTSCQSLADLESCSAIFPTKIKIMSFFYESSYSLTPNGMNDQSMY